MSESPSSAVTTATDPSSRQRMGGDAAVAGSPMAILVADGTLATPADPAAEHAAALALDEQGPHDLLWPAPATVEFFLPDDAPFYAVTETDDWSGALWEAARGAGGVGSPLDLVHDGGSYLAAEHWPIADDAVEAIDTPGAGFADPLVDLGLPDGTAAGLLSPALDAPALVDVAIDESARVGLAAPDLLGPELSWLAALADAGQHVGEAWAWSDAAGGYVFDHYV